MEYRKKKQRRNGEIMNNIGYKKILLRYLDEQETDRPILTADVARCVARETGLSITDVKKAVNVNMARLEKSGRIARIEKGVYCHRIKTVFGYYMPDKETLFCRQFLHEGDEVIGYETGLSLLNRVGLVSQMPKCRCIATNLYNKRVPDGIRIEIKKPAVRIDGTNYRYLQILDAIRETENAPVDAANPEAHIRKMVQSLQLDPQQLIFMARKYYRTKTLLKTIDIMLGGLYETT